jgi:hypothetical protein
MLVVRICLRHDAVEMPHDPLASFSEALYDTSGAKREA